MWITEYSKCVAPKLYAIKSLYLFDTVVGTTFVWKSHLRPTQQLFLFSLYFSGKSMIENTMRGGIFIYVQNSANSPSTFKNTHKFLIGSHLYVIPLIMRPNICRKNGWDWYNDGKGYSVEISPSPPQDG